MCACLLGEEEMRLTVLALLTRPSFSTCWIEDSCQGRTRCNENSGLKAESVRKLGRSQILDASARLGTPELKSAKLEHLQILELQLSKLKPPKPIASFTEMHLMYTLDAAGNRVYTLNKVQAGEVTKSAHPARFSPDDK